MSVNYYNKNSEEFFNQTINSDMSYLYNKFLKCLNKKEGKILDLGCGSGRDSKYFKDLGYEIVAVDISENLAKKASKHINQEVIVMDMKSLEYYNEFIGVWACASILHLEIKDIEIVLKKIFDSLKKDGILYASFKYGENDYMKDERNFTCFTKEKFFKYFKEYEKNCIDIFETSDVREGRESEKWVNIILKK